MGVLVTGGAGFIGSVLVGRLLRSGHPVTVLDNFASGERGRRNAMELRRLGAHVCEGDLRDGAALEQVLPGHEQIAHLAAMASVPESFADPRKCWEVNVEGTCGLLQAARGRVRRVVFISSASVYGVEPRLPSREEDPAAPASPYAESKLRSEFDCQAARAGGLETVALRLFNVYGPGQDPLSSYSGVLTRWTRALQSSEPVALYGDGSQTRDFVHVEDTAAAIAAALFRPEAPFGPINIGSGSPTSLWEVLSVLSAALGREPELRRMPSREGDVRHSCAEITRAREFLGFRAGVGLREGIASLLSGSEFRGGTS